MWACLWYRLDAEMKNHLEYQKITTTFLALEELLTYALKHKSDQRKVKTNKVQLRNMNHGGTGDRSNKRHRSVDGRTDAQKKTSGPAQHTNPPVTMENYNNLTVFRHMNEELRAFLKARNGCTYCRQINVDANHGTPRECGERSRKAKAEREAQHGKKDFPKRR